MKRLIAIGATMLLSLNASAGYVQYNLTGPLSGYFVQREDNQAISYYQLTLIADGYPRTVAFGVQPYFGEGYTGNTAASTFFQNNGPTNFVTESNQADWTLDLALSFARSTQGNFEYTATFNGANYMCDDFRCGDFRFQGTYQGIATKGSVNTTLAQYLDQRGGYSELVAPIIPTFIRPGQVAEPASIALLAISSIGAVVARRRKSALAR